MKLFANRQHFIMFTFSESEAWYETADTEERAALRNELIAEISQYYLHRFETAVKNNDGHFSLKVRL